jgi:hypothetical protein
MKWGITTYDLAVVVYLQWGVIASLNHRLGGIGIDLYFSIYRPPGITHHTSCVLSTTDVRPTCRLTSAIQPLPLFVSSRERRTSIPTSSRMVVKSPVKATKPL